MKPKNLTLGQFQRRFRSEKACLELLFELRWPDGYRCPKCNHSRYSFHSTRKLYQCAECKYQVSVTAGTIFHKTRTPLAQWFLMIFLMTRQKSGVSMLSLQNMLGISSYKTVWTMAHKIRKAMADRDAEYQLTGLVETLQTFLGSGKPDSRRPGRRGQAGITVSIEDMGDGPGFATIKHAEDSQPPEVMPGEASSPELAGENLSQPQLKLGPHDSVEALNPVIRSNRKPKRLRWALILTANLKGALRGVHHGVSEKHLHRYLAEFSYRFNRRERISQLVYGTLQACVATSSTTFAELIL